MPTRSKCQLDVQFDAYNFFSMFCIFFFVIEIYVDHMILISVMVCDQEQAPVEGTNVTNASHSSASDVPVEVEMKVKNTYKIFNIEMPSVHHISMIWY